MTMNVFLIGYRGSGKTTVAAALAARLGWPWLDADELLERRAGKTIRQIFEAGGETAFRDLETAMVKELARYERHILALGGGAVLREENRAALAGRGKFVWLQAPAEVLFARMSADETTAARRPNLTGQGGLAEIRSLLAERQPLYGACANVTIDAAEQAPDDIARQIIAELGLVKSDTEESA
jgi:shikimate kinase